MRQFLTNEKGERTAVVLPIGEYEELMERLEDAEALREADEVLAAIERGEEEVISWERVRDRIGSEYNPDKAAGP
jgi:PHD/YefM family antitoxin component YafN of YafNO toxin-antitoxin module